MIEEYAEDSYKIYWKIETNTIEKYNKMRQLINKINKVYNEMYENLLTGMNERNDEHILTMEISENPLCNYILGSVTPTEILDPNIRCLTENQIRNIINEVNYNWETPTNRSDDQLLQNEFFH